MISLQVRLSPFYLEILLLIVELLYDFQNFTYKDYEDGKFLLSNSAREF